MRKSYAEAVARAAPVSIWHLDEIDALPDRAKLSTHALEWWNVLVSDALNLVDSAMSRKDSDSLVVVVGTTNAIDRVDPALLRPGRLERAVEIEPPALDGVVNILRFHLDGELAGEDLAGVGALLQGSTPAEIMQAVRTARRAARHAGRPLLVGDLAAAALPPEAHPPLRLFRMAVHEAAHAVVALALSAGAVDHVFLKAEGHRRGTTRMRYRDDDLATRQAIEDRVVVALAARAAERLFTGSVSTGGGGAADSDIGVATLEVAALHASYGLRGAPIYLGAGEELQGAVAYDPALREAVGRDLRRLERRAGRLVAANRAAILAVARRLAERRHLTGAEIESIVRGRPRARRRGSSKTNP